MTEQRNEAAERLRTVAYGTDLLGEAEYQRDIDNALAEERRATVERIRAAIAREGNETTTSAAPFYAYWRIRSSALNDILDEEASAAKGKAAR